MKKLLTLALTLALIGCARYQTPDRGTWDTILRGASFGAMTHAGVAGKTHFHLGAGGQTLTTAEAPAYMMIVYNDLADALRVPGIRVERIGHDVLIVMVRSSFMDEGSPEISDVGVQNLRTISRILARHDRTFMEISGYSDQMADQNAALAFSFDMAERVALFLAQHRVRANRMFVIGRGSARPIADQTTAGRHLNRRVEIRITPVIR